MLDKKEPTMTAGQNVKDIQMQPAYQTHLQMQKVQSVEDKRILNEFSIPFHLRCERLLQL